MAFRVGTGYDVHRLVPGRHLILGGGEIAYEKGLLGHSDADVLCHAVVDALFGAAGLGDIGRHFPDTDPKYKDVSGSTLLRAAAECVRQAGWKIENVDSTVIAQAPRIAPFVDIMRRNIAEALGIDEKAVNVKGKTEEGLGFTGSGEGISVQAICLLSSL